MFYFRFIFLGGNSLVTLQELQCLIDVRRVGILKTEDYYLSAICYQVILV